MEEISCSEGRVQNLPAELCPKFGDGELRRRVTTRFLLQRLVLDAGDDGGFADKVLKEAVPWVVSREWWKFEGGVISG